MSNIIATRKHKTYENRVDQLSLNFLAQAGGRAYTDAALKRYPNESNLSWSGDGSGIGGRSSRVAAANDAGRISEKINQYIFSRPTTRVGIDEVWAKDVTGGGVGIASFWAGVSEAFTAGQWVWLKADRGAVDQPRSLAARPASDRVAWTSYPSTSVPDWSLDANGKLQWLITEEVEYINVDPTQEATEMIVRYLWIMSGGKPTWVKYAGEGSKDKGAILASGTVSGSSLPFVLLGHPCVSNWWFDSVESIQALLLNLESSNTENILRTVFPQLIISQESFDSLQVKLVERFGSSNGEAAAELARELVRGLDVPLVESVNGKGVTRYLTPNTNDLNFIPTEIKRKRVELFDSVGLSLFNRESRMVESAEARAFSQLDINSTLCNRALVLQEAEVKLVEASKIIDTTFKVYEPIWPRNFSVVDTVKEATALKALSEVATTEEQIDKVANLVTQTLDRQETSQ